MGFDTLFNTIDISGSGSKAQKLRMDSIASNLANVNSTRTPEGGPYKRKVPIFTEIFSETLGDKIDPRDQSFNGVDVLAMVPAQDCFKQVYDPGHPDANREGYVTVPNIDPISEMVNLVDASRAYEANISVIRNTRQILADTINLLRGGG